MILIYGYAAAVVAASLLAFAIVLVWAVWPTHRTAVGK